MKQSSEHVFNEFARGNPHAFTRLYNETYAPLFWFAHGILKNPQDAQDVVADVYSNLWVNREQTGLIKDMTKYLYTAVRNACIDFIRRTKIKEKIEQELSQRSESVTEQVWKDAQIKAEILQFFKVEIQKLSPKHRSVFNLSFVQGLDNQEVAEQLQISYQVLRNYQAQIRKVLRISILAPAVVCGLFFLIKIIKF